MSDTMVRAEQELIDEIKAWAIQQSHGANLSYGDSLRILWGEFRRLTGLAAPAADKTPSKPINKKQNGHDKRAA